MNIFKIIVNGFLKKKDVEGIIQEIDLSSPVVELKRDETVEFSSDVVVPISGDEILDTEDKENTQKYKSNLKVLVKKAKEEWVIREFAVIREDDIFPYDWKWRVSTSSSEYGRSNLTYAIRMAKAEEMVGAKNKDSFLQVPVDTAKLYEQAKKIDSSYGQLFMPMHFRSTKHFTVNTPLGYTGGYNSGIDAERNFIVIDKVDNFLNSGYGYSMDYVDAYLDITHEELPISDDAVILIPENKYNDVIRDSEIRSQLGDRHVIVFRGDESVAINMVLSEKGILPSRPGGMYMEYDNEMFDILDSSMKELCSTNNLDYAQGHGNINGVGGHFSDLYDSMYEDDFEFNHRFEKFLKNYFPEYSDLINGDIIVNPYAVVKRIGSDRLNGAILLFNDTEKKRVSSSRKKYDSEREMLTDDERRLFQDTVKLIRKFYSSSLDDSEIKDFIRRFYHSSSVDEQISTARVINTFIREKLLLEGRYIK